MLHARMTIRCLLILALLLLAVPLLVADQKIVSMISEVVESFDKPTYAWKVFPSKFGVDQSGKSLWDMRYVDAWPEALFGRNRGSTDLKCLGVRGSFLRKGYNYVEIVPGKGEGDRFQPEPIQLPGRVQNLDLWVWGGNFNYYMEVHIQDYRGVEYVLPLGSLHYAGWNNLSAFVPGNVPQSDRHIPSLKNLLLTKLVIWTRPEERVDDFITYIDHLKVFTDRFESRFDGDELVEPERLEAIWGTRNQ